MIGWLIVAGIGLILFIVGIILNNCLWWDWAVILIGIGIIMLLLGLILGLIAPLGAKQEYAEFEETRTMIVEVYEDNNEQENYAISLAVIEANDWLTEAKASKKMWGIFSIYYFMDVENIGYISLPKK